MNKRQLIELRGKLLRTLGEIGLGTKASNAIVTSIGAISEKIRGFADDKENEET